MNEIIGMTVLGIGLIISIIGNIAYFYHKEFFTELLIGSIVDTAGFSLILIGIMIYMGLSYFSLKVLIILILCFVINPIMSCAIGGSAYRSGFKPLKQEEDEDV
ncbi:hypothetical protein PM10SUCC1_03170 [Propionigenium maris DSM 9537]|uniref:Multicomponent Na+:H+ antiporter subunit G n=1 Tax=Propionigenium maris DSM 9537 TaxID=1123000 RepID=A0A9W6GIP6_9FUSO|nr:monovalent cation/H(+) antiporter subunit G [Propionigenium maris]GLI54802.1 hypothetical protein PM10SUCC1_03170 [Propionigenium maris DSM 9537]